MNYKIKEPKQNNIDKAVKFYNSIHGRGIQLVYNLKNGKIYFVSCYSSSNKRNVRILNIDSKDVRMSYITSDYLMQEVSRIINEVIDERIAWNNKIEELKARRRARVKLNHY